MPEPFWLHRSKFEGHAAVSIPTRPGRDALNSETRGQPDGQPYPNTVHLCSASVGQTIGLRRLPAPRVADRKRRWSAPPKVNSIEPYPG